MSHSRSFGDLLTEYMSRTGIGDAELARRVNVNRLTLIRWREGVTERPRHRQDVARCADVLRLTQEERDEFLQAAGFQPDVPTEAKPVAEGATPPQQEGESQAESGTKIPARGSLFNLTRAPVAASLFIVVALAAVLSISIGIVDFEAMFAPDPTVAPTPVARRTSVPVPTATPTPAVVAQDGESLILLAPFANYTVGGQGYNVSGRLRERIDAELDVPGLPNARTFLWPVTIHSESEARDVTERSGALLTIWGEYDSGRVLARVTTPQGSSRPGTQRIVDIASTPSQLPATINVRLVGAVRHLALVTAGRVYLDQGNYDHAKAVLLRAANPPPADPDVLADVRYLLGMAYLDGELFDFDESIVLLSLVLEAKPRSVDALNGRAIAYLQRGRDGDTSRALADLDWAISLSSDSSGARYNRALASAELGYYDAAERDLSVYRTRAESLPEQACREAYLAAADVLSARIAEGRDGGDTQNLDAARLSPINPGRLSC